MSQDMAFHCVFFLVDKEYNVSELKYQAGILI